VATETRTRKVVGRRIEEVRVMRMLLEKKEGT
jgi:hypothetical protein